MKNPISKVLKKYNDSNIVIRASFWFLLVTIIDKGISVITQPIVNRILSVEEVGVFGVYMSWNAIFSVLSTFNLFGGVLEVYLTKEENNKKNIIAYLCSLCIGVSGVFWLFVLCLGDLFSSLLNLNKEYIALMAISVVSEAIIQFWTVPKRFVYSYKAYGIMVVSLFFSKSVLSVVLSYYFSFDRVFGRIAGLTFPSACVAIVLLFFIFHSVEWQDTFKYWKWGLLFNIPLIPHYLCSILLASSDKVMIEMFDSKVSAGLYTVAYSYSSLALIVFNALNSAYNPMSMKCIRDKNYSRLSKSTNVLVFWSVVFSIYMMLFAPEGLLLLGGREYVKSAHIVPVLIAGIFFSAFYFVFSNVEFVYEKTKMIFPITLVGAVLNIVLNYLLISRIGYEVAAYTTFVGYIVVAIAHYIMAKKIIGFDIYDVKCIAAFVLLLVTGAAGTIVLCRMEGFIRYILIVILSIVIGLYIYKNKESYLSF